MILLRSTHEKIIQAYDRALSSEKESHKAVVAALEARIADLRAMVFVSAPSHSEEFPARVVNAVLDGRETMPQENEDLEAEMREANRILSGEYDNVHDTW